MPRGEPPRRFSPEQASAQGRQTGMERRAGSQQRPETPVCARQAREERHDPGASPGGDPGGAERPSQRGQSRPPPEPEPRGVQLGLGERMPRDEPPRRFSPEQASAQGPQTAMERRAGSQQRPETLVCARQAREERRHEPAPPPGDTGSADRLAQLGLLHPGAPPDPEALRFLVQLRPREPTPTDRLPKQDPCPAASAQLPETAV
jgi:hypothetical protein